MLSASDLVSADPYPTYAELRTAGRVHRFTLTDGKKAWLVTHHADVRALYADPRLKMDRSYSSDWEGLSLPPALGLALANTDPPVHTRLRKLLSGAFTVRRIENLRPRIQQSTDELLDEVSDQGHGDLVSALARPLPVKVFRELFGIPAEDDNEVFGLVGMLFLPSSGDKKRLKEAIVRVTAYLHDMIRRKQREPGDDLLSALIKSKDVEDRLTEDELTAITAMLMVAGVETTSCLISSSILMLLRQPGLLAALSDDPELVRSVVEETLRYECPVPASTRRFAAEDITIGDVSISSGDAVILSLASAARDPGTFTEPDRFDHGRADAGRHMSFGHGIHHCVGAPLARLEAEIAVSTVLRRLPGLSLAVDVEQLRWRDNMHIRGVHELPLTWDGSPAAG